MKTVLFRRASLDDAFSLIKLHHLAKNPEHEGNLFLDYEELCNSLKSDDCCWIVAEKENEIIACVSALIDKVHKISKINNIRAIADLKDKENILKGTLTFLLTSLKEENPLDLIYTTTRALTIKEQEMTIDLGYKVMGIFPSAMTRDKSRLNGLTVKFEDEVLEKKRFSDFQLHPGVSRLYNLAKKEINLNSLPIADLATFPKPPDDPTPPLEIIDAPMFVSRQFALLKKRSFLSSNYFPFHVPNIMITDADQEVSIFVKHTPEFRFAVIIAEHLKSPVDPVKLYQETSRLLYEKNVSYIEVINDAADVVGIDSMLRAGYLPCAYFPCFKKHGELRRDFVIFAKSFERLTERLPKVRPQYLDYLNEYYHIAADRGLPLF